MQITGDDDNALLSSCQASVGLLCPILVTYVQKGDKEIGKDPKVSDKNDQRDGVQAI